MTSCDRSFWKWLNRQQGRYDAVGRLARDLQPNPGNSRGAKLSDDLLAKLSNPTAERPRRLAVRQWLAHDIADILKRLHPWLSGWWPLDVLHDYAGPAARGRVSLTFDGVVVQRRVSVPFVGAVMGIFTEQGARLLRDGESWIVGNVDPLLEQLAWLGPSPWTYRRVDACHVCGAGPAQHEWTVDVRTADAILMCKRCGTLLHTREAEQPEPPPGVNVRSVVVGYTDDEPPLAPNDLGKHR